MGHNVNLKRCRGCGDLTTETYCSDCRTLHFERVLPEEGAYRLESFREELARRDAQPRWVTPALIGLLLFVAAWIAAGDAHTLHEAYQHVLAALAAAVRQ